MADFPAVRLLTRFGGPFAAVTGLSLPLFVACLMGVYDLWNWIVLALSCLAGVLVGFVMKVLAELARVISDMLIPR